MRDTWVFTTVINFYLLVYFGICLAVLVLAIRKAKTRQSKTIAGLIVLALAATPPTLLTLKTREAQQQNQAKADEFKQRYDIAKARFDEHCKTAGEKIYRTVDNVESVLLAKRRPDRSNLSNQYAMDDPYGDDSPGEAYAYSMLSGRDPNDGHLIVRARQGFGYPFAVMVNKDGMTYTHYRQAAEGEQGNSDGFIVTPYEGPLPRYSISYEDLSTREDRDHWVAGSRLMVTDTKTNEIIAERIGWMFDAGLGSTAGGRSPWAFAAYNACPAFPKPHGQYVSQLHQARNFVEKVLKPSRGEYK